MKIIFFGTPNFAVPTLEALLKTAEIEVLGVVTQPDKRRGRGNQMIPSPVKAIAVEHQIPVWQPARLKKDLETLNNLRLAEADAFVVVAYGQILSPEILAMPRLGCINVHGSLLPQYRGAAPMQWGIYNGDRVTGITTMLMDQGMDTGAMLLKVETPIQLFDNIQTISEKLSNQGAELLLTTLFDLAAGKLTPISQNNEQATYATLLKKEDFKLDWTRKEIEIHNQVRGFYPNCFTEFRGQVLKVSATIPLRDIYQSEYPPQWQKISQLYPSIQTNSGQVGEIVAILKNWGPVIQTGQGLLLLQEVQLAGRRVQSAWDWVNGNRLEIGEQLGL